MSEGVTPSERYLNKLCRQSFLSLWSYANLRTDEGRRKGKGVGNELCDLLIVFGDDVIIFSDKYIKFNESIDTKVAWGRWYKKAVVASARQLYGAEAWIQKHSDRIFLDPQCSVRFPIPIPEAGRIRVHRVAVALGVFEACKNYFGGNSIGSLIVNSALVGESHFASPFQIGRVTPERGFVHVFDDFTLDAVLREMDTAPDFITYLSKRERFLSRDRPIIMSPGEEQLLSIYLTKNNDRGEHDFVLPGEGEPDWVSLDESFWDAMVRNPQYVGKKKANVVSYAWDRLIEHFIKNLGVFDELGNRITGQPRELEWGLRVMASEHRIRRRQLARSLIGFLENLPDGQRATRLVYSNDVPERAYLFLVLPVERDRNYDEYRDHRKALLSAYCTVAKLKCPNADMIVGIAMEPPSAAKASEDLFVLETRHWTREMEQEARQLQEETGLLLERNIKWTKGRETEYPVPDDSTSDGLNRKQRRAVASRQRRERRKGTA